MVDHPVLVFLNQSLHAVSEVPQTVFLQVLVTIENMKRDFGIGLSDFFQNPDRTVNASVMRARPDEFKRIFFLNVNPEKPIRYDAVWSDVVFGLWNTLHGL